MARGNVRVRSQTGGDGSEDGTGTGGMEPEACVYRPYRPWSRFAFDSACGQKPLEVFRLRVAGLAHSLSLFAAWSGAE